MVYGQCPWRLLVLYIEGTCTFRIGNLLRRRDCGSEPIGQCVYCGGAFCDEHGVVGEDYYQVCGRDRCQAKWQDIADHKDWVALHYHDNLAGYCAAEQCDEALDISCERCSLRYCQQHVRATTVRETDLVGTELIHQLLLCPHCADRRALWD